jgi:hypothetical protein
MANLHKPLHVTAAAPLGGTRLAVGFSDGRQGTVDLHSLLTGPMLQSLRDPQQFAHVRLDHDLGTLVWPNGADLAPEALYFLAFEDDPSLQDQFQLWGYCSAAGSGCRQR